VKGIPNSKLRRQMIFSIIAVLALFALSTVYGLLKINSIGDHICHVVSDMAHEKMNSGT
jgi:hypothetical protein